MKCFRIKVIGKVQGVFFRASTKTQADNLGLNGWVKNEQDGSVMIEVEGEDSTVQEFIKWCRKGSQLSRVDTIHLDEISIQNFLGFKIAY